MLGSAAIAIAVAMTLENQPAAAKGSYKGCQVWVSSIQKGRKISPFFGGSLESTRAGHSILEALVWFKGTNEAGDGDCTTVDCSAVRLVNSYDGHDYDQYKGDAGQAGCGEFHSVDKNPLRKKRRVEGIATFYFSIPDDTDVKRLHLLLGNERLLLKK